MAFYGTCRRRAVSGPLAGRAREPDSRRPRPGLHRHHQPAAADHAVRVARRSGQLRRLSRLLPRPRTRAPVVGAGRRMEELPRAVAQRRASRSISRRSSPSATAAPACSTTSSARWRGGRLASPTRGRSTWATGWATSRRRPHLPRAGLQQGRARCCTCCGACWATRCSSGIRRFYDSPSSARRAPTTCGGRSRRSRAARSRVLRGWIYGSGPADGHGHTGRRSATDAPCASTLEQAGDACSISRHRVAGSTPTAARRRKPPTVATGAHRHSSGRCKGPAARGGGQRATG